jgi:hypothetical protein
MNIQQLFDKELDKYGIVILPEMEAKESIQFISSLGHRPTTTILDPWYNRGIGGVRDDYVPYILDIINTIKDNTDHLFLWGFPEIVANFVNKVGEPLEFVTWLTWFFKNCPSVIMGWRSSQQACLHYATKEAIMHPENFFNAQQELRFENNQMRFIPGPNSVIEEPLLVGFVGKKEQTGHPAQKPEKVYEKLILMTSKMDDLIYDPMAGSGTTGAVCRNHKRRCILSDISDEYLTLAEKRLGVKRFSQRRVEEQLLAIA